jgi:tRNA pseudouridine32 synthase/23S rRNA pseudouridine746 synthase
VSALPILFEDAEALVIDKPAGLPVDRPRSGATSIQDRLEELKFGFQWPPAPVHRLDQDTSGCLLLARNPRALKRFGTAFEARQVEKTYLGLVAGEVTGESGSIELSLAKISSASGGWRMIPAKKGKPAVTHWTRLAVHDGISLVQFNPVTGRTHQIRIHALAGLGFALVGDPVYGTPDSRVGRTMLHASGLIVQRGTRQPIRATAPFPTDFRALGFESMP